MHLAAPRYQLSVENWRQGWLVEERNISRRIVCNLCRQTRGRALEFIPRESVLARRRPLNRSRRAASMSQNELTVFRSNLFPRKASGVGGLPEAVSASCEVMAQRRRFKAGILSGKISTPLATIHSSCRSSRPPRFRSGSVVSSQHWTGHSMITNASS
jgi:hypothetical protein